MAITVREQQIAERLKAFIEMNILVVPPKQSDETYTASFNVAPTAQIPIVRLNENNIEINSYRWGLIPHWAKDDSMANKCFNARSETMAEKPTFRTAFKRSRCVIPIDGYYEWKKITPNKKQPMYIHNDNNELLYLAGLCEPSTKSASVITRQATEPLKDIHDRQPIPLNNEEIKEWLDPNASPTELQLMLASVNPVLEAYKVSTDVNSVYNNTGELIEPIN